MKSIREIYKIGKGPSSSHTMGPEKAAKIFRSEHPQADQFVVTLYGSLALTGKGHGTDRVLIDTLAPTDTKIIFNTEKTDLPHPNTLEFAALLKGEQIGFMRVMSIGGGDIRIEGRPEAESPEVYKEKSFAEIADYCKTHKKRISDYVEDNEGADIWNFLFDVWSSMQDAIQEGLTHRGTLPGGLNV